MALAGWTASDCPLCEIAAPQHQPAPLPCRRLPLPSLPPREVATREQMLGRVARHVWLLAFFYR